MAVLIPALYIARAAIIVQGIVPIAVVDRGFDISTDMKTAMLLL